MTCAMSNSGFSYKKTGLITDYFGLHKKRGGEDNDHCNMGNEDWNERLENINRREYSGTNKFTLNDRLLKGKRAGDYWAGTSMGITNVGIIHSVQQLDEKINLPPLQEFDENLYYLVAIWWVCTQTLIIFVCQRLPLVRL